VTTAKDGIIAKAAKALSEVESNELKATLLSTLRKEQAKRLFAVIGAGASTGALAGTAIQAWFAELMGTETSGSISWWSMREFEYRDCQLLTYGRGQ
jgi:hypothetical protein